MKTILFFLIVFISNAGDASFIEFKSDGFYLPSGSSSKHKIPSGYFYPKKNFLELSKSIKKRKLKVESLEIKNEILFKEVERMDLYISKMDSLSIQLSMQQHETNLLTKERNFVKQDLINDLKYLVEIKKKLLSNKDKKIRNIRRRGILNRIKDVVKLSSTFYFISKVKKLF